MADKIAVREQAGEKSREIASVTKGEKLTDLGRVSNFVSNIRLGDSLLQGPWIEVALRDGRSGWAFAAALSPQGDRLEWLLQKKMQCFFGADLSARRNMWLNDQKQMNTESDVARQYKASMALRDAVMARLAARSEPGEADLTPDFFWLNDALPGFVVQRMDESGRVFCFADYRIWQQAARSTPGDQDDRFFDLKQQMFPFDSIESKFPVWTFQTSLEEGSSRLGAGIHLQMLKKIDEALLACPLFKEELIEDKALILNDILDSKTSYRMAEDKIREELDQILSNPPRCLDDRDLLALQERRKLFDQPAANGIRVNLRAGE